MKYESDIFKRIYAVFYLLLVMMMEILVKIYLCFYKEPAYNNCIDYSVPFDLTPDEWQNLIKIWRSKDCPL